MGVFAIKYNWNNNKQKTARKCKINNKIRQKRLWTNKVLQYILKLTIFSKRRKRDEEKKACIASGCCIDGYERRQHGDGRQRSGLYR